MKENTAPRDPTPTIGLMGTFGYGNLGDAAIQDAMIQNIRKRLPGAVIYGFSLNPEDTERRHGIRSFPISRVSWKIGQQQDGESSRWRRFSERMRASDSALVRKLERWANRLPIEAGLILGAYRSLRGVNALIVSGGGQLDDYWGGGGAWSHPYTLLKYGILARLRGARYLFVSVGAGPIDAGLSKRFVRWALTLAQYRSYRDVQSRRLIERMGGPQGDPIYPDLAFSLQYAPPQPLPPANGGALSVGVGPIGYFKRGSWPEWDDAVYAAYLHKMSAVIAWLLHQGHKITYLVGESYYDRLAIEDLKEALALQGVAPGVDQAQDPALETVTDLMAALANVDLVISSRLHTLLLALAGGKPAIALSYQSKIEAMMADFGQQSVCFAVDQFEPEQVQTGFDFLVENWAAVSCKITEGAHAKRQALDEQYEHILRAL